MAAGPLSIKLRCASWQQLATIYKRDLSRGTMFLKASTPPPIGTQVRIDLTLPSASVIVLTGVVDQHVVDPQRGAGVELRLAPIPASSVWMIESALAAESKRRVTPPVGVAAVTSPMTGPIPVLTESEDVVEAEQDLVKALLAEAESLKKLNPFLVLGIGYEATDSDVRAAFGELTKRYHPDLFARYESTQLRQTAAEIFILIRDAYRKLGDETGRAQALTSLGRPPAAPRAVPLRAPTPPPIPVGPPRLPAQRAAASAPVGPPPEAKIPPSRPPANDPPRPLTDHAVTARPGEVQLPAATPPAPAARPATEASSSRPIPTPTVPMPPGQAFPAAQPRPASQPIKRLPTEPAAPSQPIRRAQSEPSVAQPQPPPPHQTDRKPINASPPPVLTEVSDGSPLEDLLDQGKLDDALAAYKVMAKKHPADRTFRAGIELCEGLRALGARDRLEAAQRFEAALEIDPSNERAARELAEMRRQATNERKGLLTRLMGKKES